MEIKVKCKGSEEINWNIIEDVQKNVKTISEANLNKLMHSMKTYGFNEPLCVWQDGDRFICLSGNQRLKALKRAVEKGWDVPSKIPVNFIQAKNEQEAKQILLSLASYFGDVNRGEINHFLADLKLDSYVDLSKTLNFPKINIDFDFLKKITENPASLDVKEDFMDESETRPRAEEDGTLEFVKIAVPKEHLVRFKMKMDEGLKMLSKERKDIKSEYQFLEYVMESYLEIGDKK